MLSRGTIYKGKTGMWAFTAHRVTGFLVLMFLLLHVVDVTLAGVSEHLYDTVHAVYGNILMRLFEVGLLGALVFHALNGLRIIAVDFFDAAVERQKQLAWVVVAITVVVTVLGGIVIVLPFFTHKAVF